MVAIAIAQITFLAGIDASETEVKENYISYCSLVFYYCYYYFYVRGEMLIFLNPLRRKNFNK